MRLDILMIGVGIAAVIGFLALIVLRLILGSFEPVLACLAVVVSLIIALVCYSWISDDSANYYR